MELTYLLKEIIFNEIGPWFMMPYMIYDYTDKNIYLISWGDLQRFWKII